MCYTTYMVKEQKRIFRIAYKKHNGTRELTKRLPRGTRLAEAQRERARMAADPKIEYAELREERK
jgi:hypothetical protein